MKLENTRQSGILGESAAGAPESPPLNPRFPILASTPSAPEMWGSRKPY